MEWLCNIVFVKGICFGWVKEKIMIIKKKTCYSVMQNGIGNEHEKVLLTKTCRIGMVLMS